MANNSETMQQSWVDVPKQEGDTLTHTSSKEELKQLLASALSEEELSDSDQLYQVTFRPAEDNEEGGEEAITQVPPINPPASSQIKYRSKIPSVGSFRVVESHLDSRRSFGDGICSLTLLVPVLILTHLAMCGIGYYLGRRWSADAGSAAMKVFHV